MDGDEFGRRVARLRAEARAQALLAEEGLPPFIRAYLGGARLSS